MGRNMGRRRMRLALCKRLCLLKSRGLRKLYTKRVQANMFSE
jgi:hypothetical protein